MQAITLDLIRVLMVMIGLDFEIWIIHPIMLQISINAEQQINGNLPTLSWLSRVGTLISHTCRKINPWVWVFKLIVLLLATIQQ